MDILTQVFSFVIGILTIIVTSAIYPFIQQPITVTLPQPSFPTEQVATTTQATTKATSTPKTTSPKPVVVKPEPKEQGIPQEPAKLTPEQVNTNTRAAMANVLCITKTGGYLYPISGSGVFVDKRGVVLTNAHVGQFFLLKDYPFANNFDCTIRIGSPAQSVYRAELLYLPEQWVADNSKELLSSTPHGTGENDYAFLLVTGRTDGSALPTQFPAIPMVAEEEYKNESVLLASYPAGFLQGITIETALYLTTAFTSVKDIFTFRDKSVIDLFEIGSTIVSQSGSSGGAVARLSDGELTGLIATASEGTTTARTLRALSVSHIDRSLIRFGQGGITGLLSGDLQAKADSYNKSVAPGLTDQLTKALKQN